MAVSAEQIEMRNGSSQAGRVDVFGQVGDVVNPVAQVEPESYHGVFGDTLYGVTGVLGVNGVCMIDGMIAVTHNVGVNGEGENLGGSSIIAWYGAEGAQVIYATLQDLDSMRNYQELTVEDREGYERPMSTLRSFYAPFPDEASFHNGVEAERVYRRGDTVVFEAKKTSMGEGWGKLEVTRAIFPLRLGDDYASALRREGEIQLSSDSDRKLPNDEVLGVILYEDGIPTKYPVSFTSMILE